MDESRMTREEFELELQARGYSTTRVLRIGGEHGVEVVWKIDDESGIEDERNENIAIGTEWEGETTRYYYTKNDVRRIAKFLNDFCDDMD